MIQEILPSTKRIVDAAKFVTLDHEALNKFSNNLSPKDFQKLNLRAVRQKLNPEEKVSLFIIIDSVNFSFWPDKGTPAWQFKAGGRLYKGSFALHKAFHKAFTDGVPLLDANYLANLKKEKLSEILKDSPADRQGNVEIPMLNERVAILQETGQVLLDEFEGSFMNILEEAGGSAVHFANLLFYFFPSFNDQSVLENQNIHFHKRAQLNAKVIFDALSGKKPADFKDIDRLNAFADYRIPQLLRETGILIYEDSLAKKIDSEEEIPHNSREEIEIRAATIWAVEFMKTSLKPKMPNINSVVLDSFLWLKSKDFEGRMKPHHKTRTIAY